MIDLKEKYLKDKHVWDECSKDYEIQIVGGHPDITAFEKFEEDFLDRILSFLALNQERPIKLMDIGCGSGRLHLRYGAKTAEISGLLEKTKIHKLKSDNPDFYNDPLLSEKLVEVWGIDFSKKMINLAKQKIKNAGLDKYNRILLNFEEGSAFDLQEQSKDILPVAVCLVNSIGVMQGTEGAKELFRSMRRAVESSNGIAIISCYEKEHIETYGLGQYESTLDVSGQPALLEPDAYASIKFKQIPRYYICANKPQKKLLVDVFDEKGKLLVENHVLKRNIKKTKKVVSSGHIETYSDYESNWYSFEQIQEWMNKYWMSMGYHIHAKEIDILRARPAQLAIFDPNNLLEDFFKEWGILA